MENSRQVSSEKVTIGPKFLPPVEGIGAMHSYKVVTKVGFKNLVILDDYVAKAPTSTIKIEESIHTYKLKSRVSTSTEVDEVGDKVLKKLGENLIASGFSKISKMESAFPQVHISELPPSLGGPPTDLPPEFEDVPEAPTRPIKSASEVSAEKKMIDQRKGIFNEISSTENNFSEALKKSVVLIGYMITDLPEQKTELSQISKNFDLAGQLSEKILAKFKQIENEAITDSQKITKMAEIYQSEEFKNYTKAVQDCTADIPKITDVKAKFLSVSTSPVRKRNIQSSLEDSIINASQRMPRHEMLLASLLKNTPQNTPEFNQLSEALATLKKLNAIYKSTEG